MPFSTIEDLYTLLTPEQIKQMTNDGDIVGAVNHSGGYAIGAAIITHQSFTKSPEEGAIWIFGNHNQRYTISNPSGNDVTIDPTLQMAVDDMEQIIMSNVANTSYLDAILIDAYNLILGRLRNRISADLLDDSTGTPDQMLVTVEKHITRYMLCQRRGWITEDIEKDFLYYADVKADSILSQIANGKIKLNEDSESVRSPSISINKTQDDLVFTKEILDSY